ncbi:MAG TPA: adenosylcobinamide amidohydrolase [Methylomirabilota bacterium]|jgi:iron complex transport system ATP-binding protein|nr:adenosylcobinamide amidohydrolase [Methylomirabilota bacterium]
MIEGVEIEVGPEAVVVRASLRLTVLSSAVAGGGLTTARSIVNLHVPKHCPWEDAGLRLDAFAARRALPAPWVGLLTAAWTEKAQVASESAAGITALAVVTVGLGNPVAAGLSAAAPPAPGTINTVVVVDAVVEPAALVNLVMTATEVKSLVLAEAGLRCPDGQPATGTSTDAVVVAATGRGGRARFGGPISEAGWVVARAARTALAEGVGRWMDERR